jgi:hypothetical protein
VVVATCDPSTHRPKPSFAWAHPTCNQPAFPHPDFNTHACAPHTYPARLLFLQIGRYGPELFDFSAERVTRSVSESLQRLQVPYLDLIQCHDIEFGSLDQVRSGF